MRISLTPKNGQTDGIIYHAEDNFLGENDKADAILVDRVNYIPTLDLPIANTCTGAKNFMLNPEFHKEVLSSLDVSPDEPVVSTLFALFNGKSFSEFIEVSFSGRLLSGSYGPDIGFANGIGLRVSCDPLEAIPSLNKLRNLLEKINYHGEVLCAIGEGFILCNVALGHFYGHFGMFNEICKQKTQDVLEFIFGQNPTCVLHDKSICVSTLVSQHPFPTISGMVNTIKAPKAAEKHLWRIIYAGKTEIVLITTHGSYLNEARRRVRLTLDNMLQYDSFIQFRDDYGYGAKFVLEQEQYSSMSVDPWRDRKQVPLKLETLSDNPDNYSSTSK